MSESIPDVWAIVELMGHVRHAGIITEEEKFGAKMGRVDVPDGDNFVTHYFGGSSVYRVTIVDEAAARAVAKANAPRPVQPYEMPKALAAADRGNDPDRTHGWDEDDDDGDDDDNPY